MSEIEYRSRWINENYIHKYYPNWNLKEKSDKQVLAIALRLRGNPPLKSTPAQYEDKQYHQITIEEYLLGGLK